MSLLLCLACVSFVSARMNPSYWHPKLVKMSLPIINAVNSARLGEDLFTISFDFQFQQFLMDLKPSEYYSNRSNKTASYPTVKDPNGTISLNSYFLMEEPELKWWKRYGYKFLFSYNKKFKLKNLLSIGKACYSAYDCSRTEFTNFVSCITEEKQCSRANLIFPRIYDIQLSRISCVPSNDLIVCWGRRLDYNNDFAYDDA